MLYTLSTQAERPSCRYLLVGMAFTDTTATYG